MNLKSLCYILILIIFFTQCKKSKEIKEAHPLEQKQEIVRNEEKKLPLPKAVEKKAELTKEISKLEKSIIKAGLVNIKTVDPSILVDLKYSSEDNFVQMDLYGDLENCYLQKDVAAKLVKANTLLKERYPHLSLLVYDGVRPLSIQRILWETLEVPEKVKHFYVAHPDSASIHNFGAAVDLTLADSFGYPLDMGTEYDFFGQLAYPIKETQFLKEGKLTPAQVNNRLILRNVMLDAGFTSITTEWWHFNACSKAKALKIYKIVE